MRLVPAQPGDESLAVPPLRIWWKLKSIVAIGNYKQWKIDAGPTQGSLEHEERNPHFFAGEGNDFIDFHQARPRYAAREFAPNELIVMNLESEKERWI